LIAIAYDGHFDASIGVYIMCFKKAISPGMETFSYNFGWIILISFSLIDLYSRVRISLAKLEDLEDPEF